MDEFNIDTRCATPGMEEAISDLSHERAREQSATSKFNIFDDEERKKSQATLLIEIGQQLILFHDQNSDAYVQINHLGFKVVYPIRSKDFREYLNYELYKLIEKGANATAITDAIATLEAVAKHDGQRFTVALRTHYTESIYVDIGCEKWRVINVTKLGYSYTHNESVRFTRKRGMSALPEPCEDSDLKLLDNYLNIRADELPLVYGWMFCALAGIKPYPILVLQGEQGTGKSTTSRVIRSLIDPSTVPLRSPPKSTRDLLVSAANNHVVVLDNLSGISPEVSDCICRLSTGGGIDCRALYTDNEQVLIDIQKPVLINGIDDIATRADLAERALIINLPVIDSNSRRNERELWLEFEQDKSKIFTGLLSALSSGLKYYNSIELAEKPRMADVAHWVTACERGLGIEGEFLNAHKQNQQHAVESAIDESPIGSSIMALMSEHDKWVGKPTELMAALEGIAGINQIKSKAWPQSTRGLSNIIKRLMPNFRRLGINIVKHTTGNREYRIENTGIYPPYPPEASPVKGCSSGGYNNQAPTTAVNRHITADIKSNRHAENPVISSPVAVRAVKAVKNQDFLNDNSEVI